MLPCGPTRPLTRVGNGSIGWVASGVNRPDHAVGDLGLGKEVLFWLLATISNRAGST